MSEVRVNNLSNENSSGGPTLSGITTFSSSNFFVPPLGDTASRPTSCPSGSLRFNTDSANLEYYRGDGIGWVEIESELAEPLGGGTSSSNKGALGARAIRAGGQSNNDTIDFFTVSSLGDAQDFGNLTLARFGGGAVSSRTRGVFMGGASPTRRNTIDFITIPSTGDALDFGDMQSNTATASVCTNIRGVSVGGNTPSGDHNTCAYITIATLGDAVDFGDSTFVGSDQGTASSSTRGITAGGYLAPTTTNIIQYVTIMTTGNFIDFGDLNNARFQPGGVSNATRAVFCPGYTPSTTNHIEFITMATTGSATDFGDSATSASGSRAAGDLTRGCYFGLGTGSNVIEFITIATTGNGKDFGDLTESRNNVFGLSNSHGGLG